MSSAPDPRVLFAAERTLLAWQRTCLTLMGFGFLIERFGLFVRFMHQQNPLAGDPPPPSRWIGIAFVVTGAALALLATVQHYRVLRRLSSADIPPRYWLALAPFATLLTAGLGVIITLYLI